MLYLKLKCPNFRYHLLLIKFRRKIKLKLTKEKYLLIQLKATQIVHNSIYHLREIHKTVVVNIVFMGGLIIIQ